MLQWLVTMMTTETKALCGLTGTELRTIALGLTKGSAATSAGARRLVQLCCSESRGAVRTGDSFAVDGYTFSAEDLRSAIRSGCIAATRIAEGVGLLTITEIGSAVYHHIY